MSQLFEELDVCPIPIGALSLRRRRDLRLGGAVGEIMLGQGVAMTSDLTASEAALGRVGVALAEARAEPVTLDDPLTGRPFSPTVSLRRAEAS